MRVLSIICLFVIFVTVSANTYGGYFLSADVSRNAVSVYPSCLICYMVFFSVVELLNSQTTRKTRLLKRKEEDFRYSGRRWITNRTTLRRFRFSSLCVSCVTVTNKKCVVFVESALCVLLSRSFRVFGHYAVGSLRNDVILTSNGGLCLDNNDFGAGGRVILSSAHWVS